MVSILESTLGIANDAPAATIDDIVNRPVSQDIQTIMNGLIDDAKEVFHTYYKVPSSQSKGTGTIFIQLDRPEL
tara:strand:- start:865 stop:1086 length:222 start_codon:yes stop_codon:yes gene_type:complete